MRSIKNICVITSRYPTYIDPTAQVFVQQFAWELADLGLACTVVCPVPINIEFRKGVNLPYRTVEKTDAGNTVTVFFPKYFGFGQRNIYITNTALFTLNTFNKSVKRVFNTLKKKPDAVYGHFISPSGVVAARMGRDFGIPAFVAYGESTPWSVRNLGREKVLEELSTVAGIVSVSEENKNKLVELELINKEKIAVFPNAVRLEHFYPRLQKEARIKFDIPPDIFVVAFVGHFIKRKGVDKVLEAINQIDGVYGIFAGKGPLKPMGKKTLYSGLVSPSDMPWFLSSADIFVLPTANEGCCNAILEAMACGLPIVTSDKPFNYDILHKNDAIFVDPENETEIVQAIINLRDHCKHRETLSQRSLQMARTFGYKKRVSNIVDWIEAN